MTQLLQGLDGFQKSLHSCALDESSLSIGRVKKSLRDSLAAEVILCNQDLIVHYECKTAHRHTHIILERSFMNLGIQANLDMTDHCMTDFCLWRRRYAWSQFLAYQVCVRCIWWILHMTDQFSWSHWVCHIQVHLYFNLPQNFNLVFWSSRIGIAIFIALPALILGLITFGFNNWKPFSF